MLKKWIKEYIQINKKEILAILGLLLFGIVVGVGAYIFSSTATKELAISSAKEVFEISKDSMYIKTNIIANGVKADILLILVLTILSVTLFGNWLMYIVVLLKGVAISIYTAVLFNIFGTAWGVIVFALLVVLVNVLYIPAFIYLITNFLEVHFNVFKARINTLNLVEIYKVMMTIFFSFVVMFSSIVVEQLVSNIVLNIYAKL